MKQTTRKVWNQYDQGTMLRWNSKRSERHLSKKVMITRVVSFICLSIQQTVWSQLTRIFLGRVETTNQIHPKLQATTFIDALMRVLSQSKRVYYSDINMYLHPFWAMPLQTKQWFEYTVVKSHGFPCIRMIFAYYVYIFLHIQYGPALLILFFVFVLNAQRIVGFPEGP